MGHKYIAMKYILLTKLPTFASQELWRLHAEMCFNMKVLSYPDRKSHCGDKMTLWSSYLHNGISYQHCHIETRPKPLPMYLC